MRLKWFTPLAVLVIAAATWVRVAPLVEGGERLRWQTITEDGYLMLTLARNLAIGRGLSVSEGEIPSNGTQPLSTLIFAGAYQLADGDRIDGLYGVVGFQVLTALAAAAALYVLMRGVLYRGPHARLAAALAALLWFASPTSITHTQNGLETGFYALMVLLSIAAYDRWSERLLGRFSGWRCLALGAVLGLTFLARNDACFLIAVMLGVHCWRGWRRAAAGRAFGQALLIGAFSVVVASPWLWFNLTRFGHIVPVSGRAEAMHVDFAYNLWPSFVALFENALLVLRIPLRYEGHPVVVAVSIVGLAVLAAAAASHRRWLAERFSAGVGILAGFSACLFVYYCLFFGMPDFLGRYYFNAFLLFVIIGSAAAAELAGRAAAPAAPRGWRTAVVAAALAVAVVCMGLDLRMYRNGRRHLHEQVVAWVAEHVPEETWVGAVQTGTLGYYHDRTVNLDGKVNPEALEFRRDDRISEYVIQRNVDYIVDWAGIASWINRPDFAAHYELVVNEPQRNLAVLRRRPGDQQVRQ